MILAQKHIKRFWNSPTLMTWLSYSTKALSLFGVLPLVLKKFSPENIVLWYLFSTIISLQALADFGFRQTFTRFISYAYGGLQSFESLLSHNPTSIKFDTCNTINLNVLQNIVSSMKHIYKWTTLFVSILLLILGSLSLYNPINTLKNPDEGWLSWVIVFIVSILSFYGRIYLNFLEGFNKIALVRRVESLTSLAATINSIIILIYFPSLLNLIICNQFWILINTLRDWYLCSKIENKIYYKVRKKLEFNKLVFTVIWKPAWRSGISSFMSVGLTNITSMLYAQIGSSISVASFLLAMRIINQIKDISMAPFYSKIPKLAVLRVQSKIDELIISCQRGMLISNLVFIVFSISVGIFSKELMVLINSNIPFVDNKLWSLIVVAFALHRFGAMHIQIYMTTNHIISHIADGITGILYIIFNLILLKFIGLYSIPLSMIFGYLLFYCWYSAVYSYKSLNISFLKFEMRASFFPSLILLGYVLYNFFI